MKEKTLKGQEV